MHEKRKHSNIQRNIQLGIKRTRKLLEPHKLGAMSDSELIGKTKSQRAAGIVAKGSKLPHAKGDLCEGASTLLSRDAIHENDRWMLKSW